MRKVAAQRCAPTLTANLFDFQVNGFAGVDFQQSDLSAHDLARAVAALHSHQTDGILLTLITDRIGRLCAKLKRIEAYRRRHLSGAAMIVGYHLEGPYLLPQRGFSGAHDARLMRRPNIKEFERLWDASGENIRLVTLAPDVGTESDSIDDLVTAP